MQPRRAYIFDHGLGPQTGHWANFHVNLVDVLTRRGYSCTILCNQKIDPQIVGNLPAQPFFRHRPWEPIVPDFGKLARILSQSHLEDLGKFDASGLSSRDLFVFPTCTHNEFGAVVRFIQGIEPARRPAALVLFQFSDELEQPVDNSIAGRIYLRLVEELGGAEALQPIIFAASSAQLAEKMSVLIGRPVRALCMPTPSIAPAPSASPSDGRLRISYLGHASREKGALFLPRIVERILARYGNAEFLLQINANEHVAEALQAFNESRERVTVYPGHVASDGYYEILRNSDIVLMPYLRAKYRNTPSAVCSEALSAGKVIVVPSLTWLSMQLVESGGGGVTFSAFEEDAIVEALCRAIDEYPALSQRAREATEYWHRLNSAEAFVNDLIDLVGQYGRAGVTTTTVAPAKSAKPFRKVSYLRDKMPDLSKRARPLRIAMLTPYARGSDEEAALRFCLAAEGAGIVAQEFSRSEDVFSFQPDMVVCLSFQDGKTTPFPTYGLITQPRSTYMQTPRFLRNLLTYDGYLTVVDGLNEWISDLCFGARKRAEFGYFTRSAQAFPFRALDYRNARLIYVGTNWDGPRWHQMFKHLAAQGSLDVYGPPDTWEHMPDVHRGLLPFDGVSVLQAYRKAGVAICYNLDWFDHAGSLSNRLFEAVSVGAVAICRHNDFIVEHFGHSVFYVDAYASPEDQARQIAAILEEVRANPDRAAEMARRAHQIFTETFSYNAMFGNLLALHERSLRLAGFTEAEEGLREFLTADAALPEVTYIVRTGNRSRALLDRCLKSLAAQSYRKISVLLVLYQDRPDLEDVLAVHGGALKFRVVRYYGRGRSHSLWAGLRNLDTEWFGICDDDDELFPNHVAQLLQHFYRAKKYNPAANIGLVYSGNAEATEQGSLTELVPDKYVPNRQTKMRIEHFDYFDRAVYFDFFNLMMSNAFLARTELLDPDILRDPVMDIGEDLYLCAQLMEKCDFIFCPTVSTLHHYHTDIEPNSDFRTDPFVVHYRERARTRLWQRRFPATARFSQPIDNASNSLYDPLLVPPTLQEPYLEQKAAMHRAFRKFFSASGEGRAELLRKAARAIREGGIRTLIRRIGGFGRQ